MGEGFDYEGCIGGRYLAGERWETALTADSYDFSCGIFAAELTCKVANRRLEGACELGLDRFLWSCSEALWWAAFEALRTKEVGGEVS